MRIPLNLLGPASLVWAVPLSGPAASSAPVSNTSSGPQQGDLTTTAADPTARFLDKYFEGESSIGRFFDALPRAFSKASHGLATADKVISAMASGITSQKEIPDIIRKLYQAAQPTSAPTSIPDAMNKAVSVYYAPSTNGLPMNPPNLLGSSVALLMNGFMSDDLSNLIQDLPQTGFSNINPTIPYNSNFYYREGNAPFSVSERKLRAAIQIPTNFTWGQKQAVLMSPGTGSSGTETFAANLGKLLSKTNFADPAYLMVDTHLLGDIQVNAEYVAYALQYLNSLTNRSVAAVTWSQGSIDTQWALKYWPSLHNIMTDHIPISPDYAGSELAHILCPGFTVDNEISCAPSVLQQVSNSKVLQKLRSNGGDSAYVPTTTVYSAADQVVQPQYGDLASGFLKDERGVGVSNIFLQSACADQPGGGFYLHEGVLYSPTAYALIVDALTHEGPGNFSRVKDSCREISTAGLDLDDVVQAETLMPSVLFRAMAFDGKINQEPPIKEYATY